MTDDVKKAVRDQYGKIAVEGGSCCCGSAMSSCCGPAETSAESAADGARLDTVPAGADLGLGCGSPITLAAIQPGETVLDLGSGAGIDCFLAAQHTGPMGHVIGVDMTPEMITRARGNAASFRLGNVEFRLGELENLPVEGATVDVVISNCVINLVPDKRRAFAEAYRVLVPGGRLVVSDIVLASEVPPGLREWVAGYVACLSGAALESEYLAAVEEAGFEGVKVRERAPFISSPSDPFVEEIARGCGVTEQEAGDIAARFMSVRVSARKPAARDTRGGDD
ncbi:MAG: arsenite methyltransferase [Actinomycetia bacterium]|nr:arsenite methyltransferase [Actinomycetes bacterium]